MSTMRMPHSVCTISWLLLVALVGTVGLTSAADAAEEKIGDFLKYANGTALDTRTNLLWMTRDFRNLEGRAPKSWDEAMAWAEKMNQQRYGGYSGWRVPTDAEYKALYDPRRRKKSYAKESVGYPEAFEDGGGEWFWTGETIFALGDCVLLMMIRLVVSDDWGHTASISAVGMFFNAISRMNVTT